MNFLFWLLFLLGLLDDEPDVVSEEVEETEANEIIFYDEEWFPTSEMRNKDLLCAAAGGGVGFVRGGLRSWRRNGVSCQRFAIIKSAPGSAMGYLFGATIFYRNNN